MLMPSPVLLTPLPCLDALDVPGDFVRFDGRKMKVYRNIQSLFLPLLFVSAWISLSIVYKVLRDVQAWSMVTCESGYVKLI